MKICGPCHTTCDTSVEKESFEGRRKCAGCTTFGDCTSMAKLMPNTGSAVVLNVFFRCSVRVISTVIHLRGVVGERKTFLSIHCMGRFLGASLCVRAQQNCPSWMTMSCSQCTWALYSVAQREIPCSYVVHLWDKIYRYMCFIRLPFQTCISLDNSESS